MDGAFDNVVGHLGVEVVHREVKPFGDAVDDVADEVEAVDGANARFDGIGGRGLRQKVNIDNGVAALGRKTDGQWTVAAVEGSVAGVVDKSDDLLSRQRGTMRAAVGLPAAEFGSIGAEVALGLVGAHAVDPVGEGMGFGMDADFHACPVGELGLQRRQSSVDARILGVLPFAALKGKVECGGLLRQFVGRAVLIVDGDVFAVKGGRNLLHEVDIALVFSQFLKEVAKLVNPAAVIFA